MELKQEIAFGEGIARISRWHHGRIELAHTHSKFTAPSDFPASNRDNMVRLHFGLRGDHAFHHRQLNRHFAQVGGQQNIMYSKDFDIQVQIACPEVETFGIKFPVDQFVHYTQNASDQLKRFAGQVLAGKPSLLSEQFRPIDAGMYQAIRSVIDCTYTGEMRSLFLLSKSLELLVLTAESHAAPSSPKSRYLSTASDREKIIAVRELVEQRLDSPPQLTEIARLVGLNEFKLKGGFKEMFDTTVYGYIRERRLHLAARYLRDTQKTAAEIALELGYASPQHFNHAFKKKFGITPASVRKNP